MSKRKNITKYITIVADQATELDLAVNELLEAGWTLYGAPNSSCGVDWDRYNQAMLLVDWEAAPP